ncbi:MAG TPA: MFS transporter [Sphingomonadaceae bacterium]|nr:MFS transporter [Sphingomonadaceae bacterium]
MIREEIPFPRPAFAWATVAVLFLAYILSFIDRMILGLLVEPIKADLGLSDTEISLLQGLAFALFYTIGGLPLGLLLDRSSRTRIAAAGVTVWSAATALCATATGFWHLFVARMVIGVGEATLSPAAYSIIADSFPPRRLGLAMGVYGLGSSVGGGLAFILGGAVVAFIAAAGAPTVPLLGELRPWQAAFLVLGIPGLIVAVMLALLPEPARRELPQANASASAADALAHIRKHRAVLLPVFAGAALVTLGLTGAVSWLPAMLMRVHGLDIAPTGYLAGSAIIVGGLVGLVGGGVAGDWLGGRARARLLLCAATVAVSAIGGLLFPLAGSPATVTAGFTLFVIGASMTVGIAPTAVQQLTPGHLRATVSACYILVVSLVGFALGPTLVALIGDHVFPTRNGIAYALAIISPLSFIGAAIAFAIAGRAAKMDRETVRS